MGSLLKVDPDERPSTGDILSLPSLQSYLSEYMIDDNICESTLMNTMEVIYLKSLWKELLLMLQCYSDFGDQSVSLPNLVK